MKEKEESGRLRIDKWLWAARFFKTRSLASDAVEGGKVHLNGIRVKPAKTVNLGDRLEIRIGCFQFVVDVLGLSGRRGPASEAVKLYEETVESRTVREALAAQMKAEAVSGEARQGRPTKRDRRHIVRFTGGE
ncbi:MAG: RNA-binding protein [Betaproteobacteria bacterium]|nr:RNA-binding protein [Betaproteobacteria bacterium]